MTRRRDYKREWARRQREAKWMAAVRGRTRCPLKLGASVCGGPIEHQIDHLGRVVPVCVSCERRRRGLCRDCPARVHGTVGRAVRCARCQHRVHAEAVRRYTEQHWEAIHRKYREYAQRVRDARCAYKREWRKRNPDKVKAQKRRAALRQNPHVRAYLKRWRAQHPEKVREYAERRRQRRQEGAA